MRVFYFCRINSHLDESRFKSPLHIGPAYQKLLHVAAALREVHQKVWLITVPVCNELALLRASLNFAIARERHVPIFSLGGVPSKILSRAHAALVYLYFAARYVKRSDRVVFYNFFPEYLAVAIFCALRGSRAVLDIEDAPRTDERTLVGMSTRVSFWLLRKLCRRSCITVSQRIANDLSLENPLIVYGATPVSRELSVPLARGVPDTVRVVFGGSLQYATGIDLFCDAIRVLAEGAAPRHKLHIAVTGFGSVDKVRSLLDQVRSEWLTLEYSPDLQYQEYVRILNSSHVGLCLKLPGTSMGDTTFPSKVVEILRHGLLLVSTPVSDVPQLLGGSAVVLSDLQPAKLAAALWDIAHRTEQYAKIAETGCAKGQKLFSYDHVGRRFVNWLRSAK